MKAPDFNLIDQDGETHTLASYQGKWVVLYFYPKDDTPGCTTEACGFRDVYDLIQQAGTVIIGVSKDSVKSHKKFADKFGLNFPLLSDENLDTIKAYGAYGKRNMYGRIFDGVLRKTVIIDPHGKITKEYPKVTPKDHALQILKDLAELQHKEFKI